MTLYVPGPGESFRDLVADLVPGLPADVRAGVQVVTGGDRVALAVPDLAPPAAPVPAHTPSPAEPEPPATDAPVKKRRTARRRTTPAKETS